MCQPLTFLPQASSPGFDLTIDILCKVTVVLLMATVAVRLLRRSSAANRHFVWTLAISGTILIPIGVVLLPGWGISERVSALPDVQIPVAGEAFRSGLVKYTGTLENRARPVASKAAASPRITKTPEGNSPTIAYNDRRFAIGLWLLVTGGLLLRVAAACVGSHRLRSNSPKISNQSWYVLLSESVSDLNIRRKVALRQTARWVAPVTSGVLRPFIILPSDCEQWDEEQRRSALIHELAHIKRFDVFTLLLTNIACAVFWFHPLVWYARRRMKIERERACDDAVINAGIKPSTYSDHLLELSTNWSRSNLMPQGAVAMANPQHLTDRVHRILSSQCSRRSRSFVARTLIAAVVVFSITALATAGKVIVRDAEGNVIATVEVPEGGSVSVEPDDVRDKTLERLKALNQRRMKHDATDPQVTDRIRRYEEAFEIQSNLADAMKQGWKNAVPPKEIASRQFDWRRNSAKTPPEAIVGIELQRMVDGVWQERSNMLSGLLLDDRRVLTWPGPDSSPARWKVRLADRAAPLAADLAGHDPKSGVAVLRLRDPADAAVISFGSPGHLKPGSTVQLMSRAIDGSVRGDKCGVTSVRRNLKVSSEWGLDDLLQIDRSVRPGSSGGPVLNDKGQIVGLYFKFSGIEIHGKGIAQQAGAAGAFVQVQNIDSGRMVAGVVQRDGSVRVGGGR